ncbi:protein of unknown function [Granulicella pectinivorans]|jgi:hypothetical protein|uniref:DUF1844 domain-containing protein n=1 Tax=Granulicella pectinivorans TaxID=474950 RepID=A0A1I6M041_9BACT|nr:DUF1844 domain-containing protein [Granulicella pectinivorans]SFS09008.1 protein of unknown function [Granulicella pectinivorans]
MADQPKPFVVTDRRRHTMDGELRPDADPSPEKPSRAIEQVPEPVAVAAPESEEPTLNAQDEEQELPQGPDAEQMEHARLAYTQTAERLSIAIRSANPGMDHPPAMSFDGVIQSVYMSAIMQLGGGTPEGQQPQVDLMGAQQSIEMLDVLKTKSEGNRTEAETALIERATFELQVAFLEITQALARSAAAKQQQAQQPGAPFGAPTPGGRPSIVR